MGLPGSRTSLSGGRCAAWRSDTPAVETPFSSILWPRQAIERGVDDCAMEFPRSLDKKPARHSDHWHRSGAERAGSPLLEANAASYKDRALVFRSLSRSGRGRWLAQRRGRIRAAFVQDAAPRLSGVQRDRRYWKLYASALEQIWLPCETSHAGSLGD